MTINKYYLLTLALALFGTSSPSTADTFSYTFISGNFEIFSEEIDGVPEDLEGDGINLSFSFDVTNNIALTGGYGTGSADVTSGGITVDGDVDAFGVGFIFHTSINQTTDFIAGVDLIQGSVDLKVNGTPQPSEDADGNSIFAGIRSMVTDKVELKGIIERTKIEDESNTDINFGASFYLEKLFSLDVGYSFDSDGNSMFFGATKYF